MVTDPASCQGSRTSQPLKQLILNSHSPVLLSALMNHSRPGTFQALNGCVIFADTATSVDPDRYETRHHTRLRLVDSVVIRQASVAKARRIIWTTFVTCITHTG